MVPILRKQGQFQIPRFPGTQTAHYGLLEDLQFKMTIKNQSFLFWYRFRSDEHEIEMDSLMNSWYFVSMVTHE